MIRLIFLRTISHSETNSTQAAYETVDICAPDVEARLRRQEVKGWGTDFTVLVGAEVIEEAP